MKKLLHTAALVSTLAAVLASAPAWAQTAAVKVEGAWARASVQGQKATGAFMRLTAQDGARLVRAESPAAGITEVHEMKMEGDIMKMRAVPALDLPAGKTVELKPGGYHVMLMDLKGPVKAGDVVPVTLVFEGQGGQRETLEVKATARPLGNAAAAAPAAAPHGQHKH